MLSRLTLFFVCLAFLGSGETFGFPLPHYEEIWFKSGCTLSQGKSKVHKFPGDLCVFLPDGSFISASTNSIQRISPRSEVLWQIPGHFHHQLNFSNDFQEVLTLRSVVRMENGAEVRDDVLMIIDVSGKVLHQISSPELLSQTKTPSLGWNNTQVYRGKNPKTESSHFNSIYEIKNHRGVHGAEWMKPGNIIANSSKLGVFILSPDLQKVVHHFTYPLSRDHNVHDVQVNDNGDILLFNNQVADPSGREYSSVDVYDPRSKTLEFRFTASPKEMFYSVICGGVQQLGHKLFFSHVTNGGYLLHMPDRKLLWALPGKNASAHNLDPNQQIKIVFPERFLEKFKF